MVRTVLKPDVQDISINLSKSYIGRNIEVLAFPVNGNDDSVVCSKRLIHFASEQTLAMIG